MTLRTNSVRIRREALGWSVEELAERSGVPLHRLVRYEQGHQLTPPQRRKLAMVLGCGIDDIPLREPVPDSRIRGSERDSSAPAPSVWQRALAGWLGQPVRLSAVPRPGETIQGRLLEVDRTALLVRDRQAWWLVNAARLNWVQLDPQGRTASLSSWRGSTTPNLWVGVLTDWVSHLVTLRSTTGELVPARLLASDDVALLVDQAGVEMLLPSAGVHWVKRKLPGSAS